MLLVVFLLIVAVLSLTGYAISRYQKDYSNGALVRCNVVAQDIAAKKDVMSTEQLLGEYIPEQFDRVAEQMGLFLYLFDEEGQCVLCSYNSGQSAENITLNAELLGMMQENTEYTTDRATAKFDRSIAEPMLCRGISITLTQDGTEHTYYLFACMLTTQMSQFTSDILTVAVLLILGLCLVSGVFTAYTLHIKTKQLVKLQLAMQRYALGDYSKPLSPENYEGSEFEEIAILAESINSQAQRAEESSRQFVSNVSHELRTPMTIISGFVEGILDGTVSKNKRMEYLSIVSQEIQRLKMLVTSMLNLTKFDAGTIQLNYKMFTLNDTAFRTILMFENRLNKRNISVEGLDSPPVRACADPDLIGQVVYNLVENAVKFVNDGGTISFTFADENDSWIFAVRNTGNGISKEELPKIFERFYKSDASRSQDKTGLGLGLDITRRIIHLHNAQISVRSEEHVYTEFEVRLPHVDPPEKDTADET
jgi:signal transduction histidine kinase